MRYLSTVLGLALLVIVGGIVAVVASQRPLVNGDATPFAAISPSPGDGPLQTHASPPPAETAPPELPTPDQVGQPTAGSTATPGAEPTERATPEPGLSPSPDPAAPGQPTPPADTPPADTPPADTPPADPPPVPTPGAAAPTREVGFLNLGLDHSGSGEEGPTIPRYFTFSAQGPGVIRVHLAQLNDRVRVCTWRGDAATVIDQLCQTIRRGDVTRELPAGDPQTWTVSLIGAEASGSPRANLRLSFPTNYVQLRLAGFRFQGEEIAGYNGFTAELRAAEAGTLTLRASLDDGEGGEQPYRVVIQEVGAGPASPFLVEQEGSTVDESQPLSAERSYQVTLENRREVAEQAVMLTAVLEWP
jgi:hypothetical protein